MINMIIRIIQNILLGSFEDNILKMQRRIQKMFIQSKKISHSYREIIDENKSLRKYLKALEIKIDKMNKIQETYDRKFKTLSCLDKNIESIILESRQIEPKVEQMHAQMLTSLAQYQQNLDALAQTIYCHNNKVYICVNGKAILTISENSIKNLCTES